MVPAAVIVEVAGIGLTITTIESEARDSQPFKNTFTVYFPAEFTVNVFAVESLIVIPFLYQRLPATALEVKVTIPVPHNAVAELAIIEGRGGKK